MPGRLRSLAPALLVTAAIAALDFAVDPTVTLLPLLVIGPFLAAATTGPRESAAVGLLAVLVAVVVGALADEAGSADHVIAVATVVVGAVMATVVARARDHEHVARRVAEGSLARAGVLSRASTLLESGADPLAHLDEIAALTVPDLADLCVIDLIGDDGKLRIEGAAGRDPASAQHVRVVRRDEPVEPGGTHPVAVVARTGVSSLQNAIGAPQLRRWSTGPRHLALMRTLGYRSVIIVPLSARGRTIGALSLIRIGPGDDFHAADLQVAETVAQRAGLAIDHARLDVELGETASELRTVLGALAEAVTVQRPDGELVYANAAAARLYGYPTVDALLEAGIKAFYERWDVRDEHGDPVPRQRLPGRRALTGELGPVLLTQMVERTTGERTWQLLKASPVLAPDGRPRLAVNVIEDVTDQRRRERGQAFLARASKLLTASLDPALTLREVAWAAVPELADWCAVDMPDERGRLHRVATADRSPQRSSTAALVVRERSVAGRVHVGPPEVMRTGRPQYYPQVTDALLRAATAGDEDQYEALRAVGARSVLVVPMLVAGAAIGTITMGTIESARRLTEDDLALAEELGRRAGIAVEHARVHRDRSTIAATLQAALLPRSLPEVPGVEIAARFRAATGGATVGGDFYDVFPLGAGGPTDSWMIVMGDVTGKGPAAAAITSLARYAIRTAALYERSPSRVLEQLNHVLVHDDDRRRLCTAVCARVDPGGEVVVSCAGHPPPLRSLPDGTVVPVGDPGTLLGAFAEGHWSDATVHLGGGESLVLYTDGVTDARGPVDRFGAERLNAVVSAAAGQPASAVAAAVDEALIRFQDGQPQRDDVALLVLQALEG
jgi:PAS domain S-box-containing protein